MLRKVASKVAWVGRTASMVFGLALVLALLFGVASMALAKNGDPWLLGRSNVATAITKLAGAAGVNGPMLQLINNNAGTNDTALDLRVQAGEPPMRVNRATKVTNLNADKVDGLDSTTLWSGKTYWNYNSTTVTSTNNLAAVSASCDSGEDVALSGGYNLVDPDVHVYFEFTRTTYNPNYHTIHVDASDPGVTDKRVEVFVHCADFGSPHQW